MLKSLIGVFMCKKSRYGETLNKNTHPKTCNKPYIISKQKHIYYTFFRNSLHEGLAQLFCTRQVIFWSEKV